MAVRRSRTSSRTLTTLVALAAVAALIPASFATAQSDEASQLADARAQIAAIDRELDVAAADVDDADAQLADADERLAEVEAIVNDVAAQLDRQRGAVEDAAGRLAQVEAEAVRIREQLEGRAASMFKQGAVRDFDVLLSSDGAEEALARSTYLRALTVGDAATAESLAAAEVTVTTERERLEIEEQRLDDLLAEQQLLLAEVEEVRSNRALTAADARAREDQLHGERDDLEAESEQLETLIREQQEAAREEARAAEREAEAEAEADAEAEAAAAAAATPAPAAPTSEPSGEATTSAPSSSGYAWPICAPVTSEYGPRWGRMHEGLDQGASSGTSIGAAKAGTVIFAGRQGGYGNLVLIDHGDGVVTAYAHQSSIAVSGGTSVGQGQTIGSVGSTGNSTGPHLHFETRVNGSAVNPRNYLAGSPC